jgi:hypothetical protein
MPKTYYFKTLSGYACNLRFLVHIPKFRNGTGKILANASTPDFFGASDIILGYALTLLCKPRPQKTKGLKQELSAPCFNQSSCFIW